MGVDIKYITNIRKSSIANDNTDHLFNNDGCSNTVNNEGYYLSDECDYVWSSAYSTYNRLRGQLAILIGTSDKEVWANPDENTPFVELINNSDCEACFDTNICIELSKDFEKFSDKANVSESGFFVEFYNSLAKGFKIAAENNGAVIFR